MGAFGCAGQGDYEYAKSKEVTHEKICKQAGWYLTIFKRVDYDNLKPTKRRVSCANAQKKCKQMYESKCRCDHAM